MSCGRPHEVDCVEVLDRIYVFIDDEIDGSGDRTLTYSQIEQHLHECAPCLRKFDLERVVKELVARSCRDEHAPVELRAKVLTRIAQVRVEITEV